MRIFIIMIGVNKIQKRVNDIGEKAPYDVTGDGRSLRNHPHWDASAGGGSRRRRPPGLAFEQPELPAGIALAGGGDRVEGDEDLAVEEIGAAGHQAICHVGL